MWYESWDPCQVTRNTETDTLSGFSALNSDDEYEECELESFESTEREYAGVSVFRPDIGFKNYCFSDLTVKCQKPVHGLKKR